MTLRIERVAVMVVDDRTAAVAIAEAVDDAHESLGTEVIGLGDNLSAVLSRAWVSLEPTPTLLVTANARGLLLLLGELHSTSRGDAGELDRRYAIALVNDAIAELTR